MVTVDSVTETQVPTIVHLDDLDDWQEIVLYALEGTGIRYASFVRVFSIEELNAVLASLSGLIILIVDLRMSESEPNYGGLEWLVENVTRYSRSKVELLVLSGYLPDEMKGWLEYRGLPRHRIFTKKPWDEIGFLEEIEDIILHYNEELAYSESSETLNAPKLNILNRTTENAVIGEIPPGALRGFSPQTELVEISLQLDGVRDDQNTVLAKRGQAATLYVHVRGLAYPNEPVFVRKTMELYVYSEEAEIVPKFTSLRIPTHDDSIRATFMVQFSAKPTVSGNLSAFLYYNNSLLRYFRYNIRFVEG